METSLYRKLTRLLIVLGLFASFFGPTRRSDAQSQGPDGAPAPHRLDSQKLLSPAEPRVKTSAPAPFAGIQALSPRALQGSGALRQPLQAMRLPEAGGVPENILPMESQPPEAQNSLGTALGLPNLFPYTPPGWDGPVVLSSSSGATTNSGLTAGQEVYIDWSIANGGADSLANFVTCLFLDYSAFYCADGALPGGYYWWTSDLLLPSSPAAGWHAIALCADVYGEIAEDNELDNCWDAEFYWAADAAGQSPNLKPFDLEGMWSGAVVLSGQPDALESGGLIAGKPFYLNMAALNAGPGGIADGQPFSVDVSIDGASVYSIDWDWGLPAYYYLYQTNYPLSDVISAGWHSVVMSVDSGGGIPESDESDNTWAGALYWAAPTQANLLPYTPEGWSSPVQITSTPGIDGDQQLYADRGSYFHFAYLNDGAAPASHFYVNILLDGQFLYYYFDDLQAGETGSTLNYALPAGSLATGWHTVKLWLDDVNAVDEYNENDNAWEADFYWENSSLPNLHPFQVSGWEDALVISSQPGTHAADALTANQPLYFDWAVINGGWGGVSNGTAFRTRLISDGSVMAEWDWSSGLESGWYLYLQDYAAVLSAGWHFIELVTDAAGQVDEANEHDNATGVWVYVGQAQGQPEIRVEPAAISVDVAAGGASSPALPQTLQRDMAQVQPFVPEEHGLGAEITPPTRYILPEAPLLSLSSAAGASLPASVDHAGGLPPVGDQGGAGSCTAWATSYYYKSYQEGIDQGWDLTQPSHQFSPNFVWNQIQPSSTCGGTWPGDAFRLMVEKGDIPLSEMPYSEDCRAQPSAQQLDQAANYRAENYGQFFSYGSNPGDSVITQMKEWIAGGDIIQLSIPVTPEFDSPAGPYCMVEGPNLGASRGGHAITIVGYDDNIGGLGKQGFKIVNSWGTAWGCGGFAYISYDWIKSNAWEAWWMRDIRTGAGTFRDFTIHNDGAGVLTVSQIAKQGQNTWLQVVLPEALPLLIAPGASQTIQLAIDPAGLARGTFTDSVLVTSDDADEPLSRVDITLNTGAPAAATPSSAGSPYPGDDAAGQPTDALQLSWDQDLGSDPDLKYDVRLDTANPPAAVICNDIGAQGCLANHLRPNTTYYWRVVSLNNMHATLGPVWSLTTAGGAGIQVFLPAVLRP